MASIDPQLLESARVGSWEALDVLFQREDTQDPPMMIPAEEIRALLARVKGSITVPAAGDVEELLQGLTPDGDTALHVVASNGNAQDFLKYAGMICGRDRGLLFAKNHNGDTPLHCAVRAGNAEMASRLIDLGGHGAAPSKISPMLLTSARVGSCKALDFLFRREDAQNPPMMIPTDEFLGLLERDNRTIGAPFARDVEEGVDHLPSSLAVPGRELLKGVTPDGDTALHAVASNTGDGHDFLKCAGMICGRDWDLLFAKNHDGDTPLHSAARAGNSKMVSCLIHLAGSGGVGPNGKLALLRMQNKRHETALHEAVRTEDGRILEYKHRKASLDAGEENEDDADGATEERTIVKLLMRADPELANYPEDGISPLYLAIFLQKSTIALTLYNTSCGNLSYSGADGQNALHVALLRDTVMVEILLGWNKSLTAQVDKDGSTPLHFVQFSSGSKQTLEKVFKANPASLYQADNKGFFPIHVAASLGATDAVIFFLHERPDSAGLRNAKGKTFLHVATEKRRLAMVSYACGNPSLAWILNMQDSEGNTALHLAIQGGKLRMFCALFGNREVNLNLANNLGETPYDLSRSKLPRGMGYTWNSEHRIKHALRSVRANHGAIREDKNKERYSRRPNPQEEDRESERLKDATQMLVVTSVLIATMAFTATFALPGGYRADDHSNGGTPTLAGGYIFDAFILATALAFICSLLATAGFMFSGIPMVNLSMRKIYFQTAVLCMSSSVTCLSIAFALGVYMVLAPVARNTAVAISVITPAILVCRDMGFLIQVLILARPLLTRKGIFFGMVQLLRMSVKTMVTALWPFAVTFCWAAFARI
ncbi:protein ACCELERATED CELL DEATH 6-like [Lolium perenne]|uniref:protein ACCELERATED CELL DEATH 6-like n=1 Tax=Lolium perenne TaxID=4522 RepID=UPI0021F50E1A|nr:protein ACCELERATED CELL DEATH 6-like [Lolium perenne]